MSESITGSSSISSATARRQGTPETVILVEVVSAGPGCSICQRALKLVKQAAAEFPQIEARELNVVDQFERLQELNIFSAGAILINGKAEFGSLPSLPKLRERVYELLNLENNPLNKRGN